MHTRTPKNPPTLAICDTFSSSPNTPPRLGKTKFRSSSSRNNHPRGVLETRSHHSVYGGRKSIPGRGTATLISRTLKHNGTSELFEPLMQSLLRHFFFFLLKLSFLIEFLAFETFFFSLSSSLHICESSYKLSSFTLKTSVKLVLN